MVRGHLIFIVLAWSGFCLSGLSGCNTLKPGDFLTAPRLISSPKEYGHVGQKSYTVPATTDIFLARAKENSVLEHEPEQTQDQVGKHSPVLALDNILKGGETLDVYATGEVTIVQRQPVKFQSGPKGWTTGGEIGPANGIYATEGKIGALVGMFDNQRQPFIIGQRTQINVPRGARSLYLAVLDYPGASANNEGEYLVTINVIRR